MLNPEQLDKYQREGFIVVPSLFDADEATVAQEASRSDPTMAENVLNRDDGEGGTTRLTLWRECGDDTFGLMARQERMVHTAEQCIGEPVYHFHSKLIQKEAKDGGAWVWHQDYGYWYHDGYLRPSMVSCFVAIDRATKENGCLQVLAGSHELGRLDHIPVGDEKGADPARVSAAENVFRLDYCEMDPGDVVFFHSNLLHRSDQNRSDHPRWALVCCYNGVSNGPIGEDGPTRVSPLEAIGRERLQSAGVAPLSEKQSFLTD